MKFYLPLEQFELNVLLSFYIFGFDFSFNTMTFYLIAVVFLIYVFIYSGINRALVVPTMLQTLVEYIYKFIYGIVRNRERFDYFTKNSANFTFLIRPLLSILDSKFFWSRRWSFSFT